MLESSLETYFRACIASIPNIETRKYTTRMHDPDRIVLYQNGQVSFVELKRPGQIPRLGQQREFERLRARGFKVDVLDSKEAVDEWITNYTIQ